jgi:hypothetical protein
MRKSCGYARRRQVIADADRRVKIEILGREGRAYRIT